MTKLNDFGFGLSGRGTDDVGTDTMILEVSGRVTAGFNAWHSLNTTYGNGYFEINNFYGDQTGTDMLNFDAEQPDIIVAKACTVVGFVASWYVSSTTNFTGVEIGLAKATYSGATRTETSIGTDTLTGMNSLSTRYSVTKSGLSTTLAQGDGIIPAIKRTAPTTFAAAYLNGFNMQIICEITT